MAGEPESLHIHEPLKARVERHDYDRLLMLSDGVFAIAITLLALELRLPSGWDGSVESLMGATGRPLLGYLFGFGLVGIFWFMHRRLFAQLEQVDRVITILNLLLLAANRLQHGWPERDASVRGSRRRPPCTSQRATPGPGCWL